MEHQPLFDLPAPDPVPVLMCLDPPWYELMWEGQKTYEFRRRFLTCVPAQWFVYLTSPASRLCAVIDLAPAIEDTPERISQIAERTRADDGANVKPYLERDGRRVGYAMPIRRVREFEGFAASELDQMLGGFYPPRGYVFIDRHPAWRAVCDRLVSTPLVRETTIGPEPAS